MGTGQGRASGAWQEKGTTRDAATNCHLDGRPSRANLLVIRVLWTFPSLSRRRDWSARREARGPLREPRSTIRKPSSYLAGGRLWLKQRYAG